MLDTSMCICLMKDQPEQVARRFAECCLDDVAMPAITHAEFEYGLAVSGNQKEERIDLSSLVEDIPAGLRFEVLDYDCEDAREAGRSALNWPRKASPLDPTAS
jgi:predicted nucleic acid-binding protein